MPSFEGEIVDRGPYLVVRTPTVPTFYWGNTLLFRAPPARGDERRWPAIFAEEIGRPPAVRHQTFGWDSPEGDPGAAEDFVELGFRVVESSVLSAISLSTPEAGGSGVEVRPLVAADEWGAAVENQVRCREPQHDEAGYRRFKQDEAARYRRMSQAGAGVWFGAFVDGALVADLGIFLSDGLARYQNVETHPDFRRRGIATALIRSAGRFAMDRLGASTLVIVADHGSAAERLYRSIGFAPAERQVGLERW